MKNHFVLTTRCGKAFSINAEGVSGDLEEKAQKVCDILNAKYRGTDYEITGFHLAEASEVAGYWQLPESILEA